MSVRTPDIDPVEVEQRQKAIEFFAELKKRTGKLNLPQAPDKVIKALSKEPAYKAVLRRRVGNISPDDFLVNAYHFVYLVNLVYPGYVLTLGDGSGHFIKRVVLPADYLEMPTPDPRDPSQFLQLTDLGITEFRSHFPDFYWGMRQLSLQSPDERRKHLEPYANIQRSAKRPNILLFTAHSSTEFSCLHPANRRPLELFVAEHLFHVPGYPPSPKYPIEYGVNSWIKVNSTF